MTAPSLREAVARAMRTRLTVNVLRQSPLPSHEWIAGLSVALSVIRAHCLGRVREIHSRIHMTDSDAFAEQVRQRALVAWQLAEDCNTSAAGAAGGA